MASTRWKANSGQIGRDDDQRREEDRSRDLQRGVARIGFGQRLVRLCLAAAQDGLCHDDRAVDDDAEVDGAEGEQVGGDIREVHQDEGDQHRERDRDADDQGATRTAEKQNEHDEHEADSL